MLLDVVAHFSLTCRCCPPCTTTTRYAKTAGKDARSSWLEFTQQYFLKRRVLVAVMLLVDASIPPQRMDLDCANWLADSLVGCFAVKWVC